MAEGRFVVYFRVSTAKQGRSGLGLDAQRRAVANYLNGGSWKIIAEMTEVEGASREDNRPKLLEAMALCRLHNATLLIAKLDRLSRDAHFLLGLQKSGIDFVCADAPDTNRLTVGVRALLAEEERRLISLRTKEALASKRERYAALTEEEKAKLTAEGKPTRLGGTRWDHLAGEKSDKGRAASIETRQGRSKSRAADLAPIIADLRANGATSLRQLAEGLNEREIPTARGGAWSPVQVSRVLSALGV